MLRKRPTQADVARLAGVSRSVVSLVLNRRCGRVPISEETRRRVLRAIEELGYVPNPVAQMLARGSNRLIGVFTYEAVFPYRRDDFYFPFLLGIQHEASRQDYDVLLFTRNHAAGRGIYADGTNRLQLADGAVLMGPYPDRNELRQLVKEGYPCVFIGRREVPGCEMDWAASDYAAGSAEATRHLLALGHRRLAYPQYSRGQESSLDRQAGCRRAVAAVAGAGLSLLPVELATCPERLLAAALAEGATAIICEGEGGLAALLRAAQERGLAVPDDLSLVCLSDCDTALVSPFQPSQLHLNRQAVAGAAVRILVNRLAGAATGPQQVLIPCEFVAGDTTAPPPRRGRALHSKEASM